jgi:hypothetical protein
MHGMPDLVHYMEVVFTFAGELLIPYCLFFGASARLLCFWTHAALLLGIAITGNYGFFQVSGNCALEFARTGNCNVRV